MSIDRLSQLKSLRLYGMATAWSESVPDFVLHGFPNAIIVARKSVVLSYTYPQAHLCQVAITPGQNSTSTGGQI